MSRLELSLVVSMTKVLARLMGNGIEHSLIFDCDSW
jgi:hypothetical protein